MPVPVPPGLATPGCCDMGERAPCCWTLGKAGGGSAIVVGRLERSGLGEGELGRWLRKPELGLRLGDKTAGLG